MTRNEFVYTDPKRKKSAIQAASKEDFFWWQESMMPQSSRNVVTLLQNAIEVDQNRWPIVMHYIPNIKGTFKSPLCGKRDQKGYHRLTQKGAKVILDKLRGNEWGSPSETRDTDRAIMFIQGMTFGQFQILAHGCPVKIWQRLVDADYQGEDDQTMEEFTQELKHDIKHLPAASNSDVDVSDRSESSHLE